MPKQRLSLVSLIRHSNMGAFGGNRGGVRRPIWTAGKCRRRFIYSRGKYEVLYDHQKDPYVRNRKLLELAEETRDPALPALRAGTFGL